MTTDIDALMRLSPVIPVLVVHQLADAAPIAEALVAGGLRVLEVTLRTPDALAAIAAMKSVTGAIVGAGTVTNEETLNAAIAAGADFIVSPGLTEPLGRAAVARGVPYLPGVASASDMMRGLDLGLDRFKFFPAEASGGRKTLAALAAVFRQCRFCPTGGITAETAALWLAEPHVSCVGGSWLVPAGVPDFDIIQGRAMLAAALAAR